MALPKNRKKLDIGVGIKPTITNDTTRQNEHISLNRYENVYNQNNKPMQNPYAGSVLNTSDKPIVNNANSNNSVATSGIENKLAIENKPTVDIIPQQQVPQQSNNVIEETKPLQNAYDSYKAQLELDKVSAQNEISNANKVAKQYMDNYLKYYGMQGSGMGQSAYANLAAQNTQNIANVNSQYSKQLSDYRTAFNENLKQQAANDLQTLSKEDQQSYIDNLRGQSGVNEDTISNIQSQANSVNYQRDEEQRLKTEEENKQLNQNTLDTGLRYANTMNDEQWNSYIENLKANSNVSQETIAELENERGIYSENKRLKDEEEASAKAESERNQANSDAWTYGQEYAQVYSDQKWDSYINRLISEGVDKKVITNLQDYREAYGANNYENSLDNALGTVAGMIDSVKENGDYNKLHELNKIYDEIENATTQEEVNAALDKLQKGEGSSYGTKTYQEVGASNGNGDKNAPYIYHDKGLSELKDMAENGELPEGSWVQYKNILGNWIIRQVQDGELKERKKVKSGSGRG